MPPGKGWVEAGIRGRVGFPDDASLIDRSVAEARAELSLPRMATLWEKLTTQEAIFDMVTGSGNRESIDGKL